MKKLFSVLGVVAAVLVIVFVVMGSSSDNKQSAENEMGDMASSQQSSDNSANKDMSETAENVIEIKNFKFVPEKMTIKKGTTITWKNFDNTKHNVIFDDESAGEVEGGKLISNGEEVSFTFSEVGEFPYHCMPHPYMKGSVTVTE
jgi:plastocyanin